MKNISIVISGLIYHITLGKVDGTATVHRYIQYIAVTSVVIRVLDSTDFGKMQREFKYVSVK